MNENLDDDDSIPMATYNVVSNNIAPSTTVNNSMDGNQISDDDDSIPMATFNVIGNNTAPSTTVNNSMDYNQNSDDDDSIPMATFNVIGNNNNNSFVDTTTQEQDRRPAKKRNRRKNPNISSSSFDNISLGLDTLPNRRGSLTGGNPNNSRNDRRSTTPATSVNRNKYNTPPTWQQENIPVASVQVIPSATPTTPYNNTDSISSTSTPIATNIIIQNNNNMIDLSNIYQSKFNEMYLKENGFPRGLIQMIKENHDNILKRFWIIDNSGSMLRDDSHRILIKTTRDAERRALRETNNSYGFLSCTRWRELQQCILLHVETAAFIGLNTTFKLLNKPGFGRNLVTKFSVANSEDTDPEKDTQMARDLIMRAEPSGTSPLTRALIEIREEIQELAPYLQSNDKKIFVIIATDGLPTKNGKTSPDATNEFLAELRTLELYPVWIVIRLCSSDKETIAFYQGLDNELERKVDVVLTLANEMRRVREVNSWLNYTYPLQYCREIGSHIRLFDIINERPLTLDEVISLCKILFGDDVIDELPDPHVDWKGFSMGLGRILDNEEVMWNPHSNRLEKQINLNSLNKRYGKVVGNLNVISNQNHIQQESVSTKCTCTIS